MSWPAIKLPFKQEEFGRYVSGLTWAKWRPRGITIHNTAAPTLAQWNKSAQDDLRAGRQPGITRINNLETYFWKQKRWTGSPHLFIDDQAIWVFNPLTSAGVHSPSWNNTHIGIECVGDYSREDDDSGPGLKVKMNAIYAMAALCSALGIPAVNPYDPNNIARSIHESGIFLHKQDPKTDHDCPGEDMAQDISQIAASVAALMSGGDHDPADVANAINGVPLKPVERRGIVTVDDLNVRKGAGVMNESIASLSKGTELTILDKAMNGQTAWLRVKDPSGWVAGRYVQEL